MRLPHMDHHGRGFGLALVLLVALVGCGTPPALPPVNGPSPDAMRDILAPPPPRLPSAHADIPLPSIDEQAVPLAGPQIRTQAIDTNRVQLRLLVIAADDSDFMLNAWIQILDRLATPYDVFIASQTTLTYDGLVASDGTGRYNGILITNSQLVYSPDGGATWANAFDASEWNALWQYERDFAVREVDFYTYPSTYPQDFCLRMTGQIDTTLAPIQATLTPSGSSVFTYLKDGVTVPIQYAWVYQATLAPGCDATPLLVDDAGDVLAAMSTSTDGRERIAVTVAQNPYFVYTQLLGYGLVRWATHDVYLGDLRFFLKTDVDDWGIPSDERLPDGTICTDDPTYPYGEQCPPFRISAADAIAVAAQQDSLHATYPLASAFKLDIAFNGEGLDTSVPASCDPNVSSADPLSSVTRCLAKTFNWINHTFSHPYMESETYAGTRDEIRRNAKVAKALKLESTKTILKTGDFSGLGYYFGSGGGACPAWVLPPWGSTYTDYGLLCSNDDFLRGASSLGVRYIESNNSIPGHQAPCLNCGIRHPLQPDIMLLPDWPNNVHYWATTPEELTSSYNAIYGPGGSMEFFDHNLSYAEILAEETTISLYHLQTTVYPHYFHQGNLRAYASGHSLAFDWIESLVAAYSSYYKVPLLTPTWDELASYIAQHTLHEEAVANGATAVWDRAGGTITITAPSAQPQPTPAVDNNWILFVTGVRASHAQSYGGDTISVLGLSAGETVSVPAPTSTGFGTAAYTVATTVGSGPKAR